MSSPPSCPRGARARPPRRGRDVAAGELEIEAVGAQLGSRALAGLLVEISAEHGGAFSQNERHATRPMPPAAPVITAVLPSSLPVVIARGAAARLRSRDEAARTQQLEHELRQRPGREHACPSTWIEPLSVSIRIDDPGRAAATAAGETSAGRPRLMQFRGRCGQSSRRRRSGYRRPASRRHVLARGAQPKFSPAARTVSPRQLVAQRRVQALEEVLRHLGVVEDVEVGAGIEDVGVDVVLGDQDGPASMITRRRPGGAPPARRSPRRPGRRGDPGVGQVHLRLPRAHAAAELRLVVVIAGLARGRHAAVAAEARRRSESRRCSRYRRRDREAPRPEPAGRSAARPAR